MTLQVSWECLLHGDNNVIVIWDSLDTLIERFEYCKEKELLEYDPWIKWITIRNIDGSLKIGN